MSPKTFLRAGLALLALTVAACSETLAPKLERIEAQIANALTCTIVWTGAAPEADNLWQNPNNWAPARLPNSSDNACITADGKIATLYGDAVINSVTIGTPGSSNPATLQVRGLRIGTGWYNLPANLVVANGIDNSGVLSVDATGFGPGAVTIQVNGGAIENRAGARFVLLGKDFGAGSGLITHYVNGNVVNDGTLDIRMYAELRGHYTNRGTAIIAENPNVEWEGPNHIQLIGGSWKQDAGELRVDTRFWLNDGVFRLNHGAITGSGSPILYRGTLLIGNGSTATGMVTVREAVTFSGNVYANQTLVIDGNRPSTTGFIINTDVTAASSFTNNGIVRLTGTGHAGGTATTLVVPNNGTITNNGRIESTVPDAGGRVISAGITNTQAGTIRIAASTALNQAGGIYRNEGSVQIDPNMTLTVDNAAAFVQQGGTLGVSGAYNQTNGVFQIDGGLITGTPWLAGTLLTINNTEVPATLRLTHTTRFTGNIGPQQKLMVETIRPFSTSNGFSATLDVAGNTVNHGTIRLWATGAGAGPAFITVANGATLTNAAGARIEVLTDYDQGNFSNGRELRGNFVNEGTLHLATALEYRGGTMRTLAPATVTNSANFGGFLSVNPGATLYASGNFDAHLVNAGNLHIGAPGAAAALNVGRWYDGKSTSSVTVEIGGSPGAPGTDFDRMTLNGPMTFGNGTLHVRATNGACIDGGKSFEVLRYSHPSGNFLGFSGLDLGGGRTVQPVQQSSNYLLNVIGPVCVPPDVSAPMIAPTVTGTPGLAGWYVSDVQVTWSVTDGESPVTSTSGCDDVALTTDSNGETYTCTATSAGGTATQSVTIKRDATPPVITTSQSPMPNAHGWNNTNVTAFWSATDAMSGLEGSADRQAVFNGEGLRMNFGGRYYDKAGNVAVALIYASIDRTAPVVSASRAPEANFYGWNNVDVTATYTATDALSGLDGAPSATQLFSSEGGNQSGSQLFTDKAGNSATASISGISIDKTGPVITATRSPLPDATGWNNTDVTVTFTATDALSGVGVPTFTVVLDQNGANQTAQVDMMDRASNTTHGSVTGINIDKTPAPPPPPTVLTPVCSVTPSEIWPANNKMVAVRATVGGTGVTSYSLRSVVNNESGAADVSGWAIGTADVDGSVLAKRNGGGSGRTYTLTYDVFGANGATGSCAVMVRVPHDQRR